MLDNFASDTALDRRSCLDKQNTLALEIARWRSALESIPPTPYPQPCPANKDDSVCDDGHKPHEPTHPHKDKLHLPCRNFHRQKSELERHNSLIFPSGTPTESCYTTLFCETFFICRTMVMVSETEERHKVASNHQADAPDVAALTQGGREWKQKLQRVCLKPPVRATGPTLQAGRSLKTKLGPKCPHG